MRKIHNLKKLKPLRKSLRKNTTEEESLLWRYLNDKQLGYKFRRQHSIGRYIVDFYCPSKELIVEIDGSQHLEDNAQYDQERTKYFNKLGLKVLRFWNSEVRDNLAGVVEEIKNKLL